MNRIRAIALLLLTLSATAHAQAPVRVEIADTRAIAEDLRVTGTVSSPRSATLSPAVAGLVSELRVDEGSRVDAGELLLRLDDELGRIALQRARANVVAQQATLDDARRRLAEAEKIGPEGGIAETRIAALRAEVARETAALDASRADAAEQAALVERHAVRAPFAGVITRRTTELGEWVSPGNGLLDLVATDGLRFDFRPSQQHFDDIGIDTAVTITLDAYPGVTIDARVAALVPVKDPGSRTFLVRALPVKPTETLAVTPGMSVQGLFSLASGRDAVTVTRDALLRFPDGRSTVWVVESVDGRSVVRERVVRPGVESGGRVEISSGLSAGERVVSFGNESLRDGQAVTVLDADA